MSIRYLSYEILQFYDFASVAGKSLTTPPFGGLNHLKLWVAINTPKSTSFGQDAWRGGLVVGRRTCDLVVAGSRPGRDAAA